MDLQDKIVEAIAIIITPNIIMHAKSNLLQHAQLCIECDDGYFKHLL